MPKSCGEYGCEVDEQHQDGQLAIVGIYEAKAVKDQDSHKHPEEGHYPETYIFRNE